MDKAERAEMGERKRQTSFSSSALVTGASSGIGLAITRRLLQEGITVYGIGRDFSEAEQELSPEIAQEKFYPLCLDLRDTEKLIREIRKLLQKTEFSILVNNAGTAFYGLHETLMPEEIQEMVRVNLELPMLLTKLLLPGLRKSRGQIVMLSSHTAEQRSAQGSAYGATKAGLLHFAESLYEEVRKQGVRVTTILPDMTETRFYRNADFTVSEDEEAYLLPEDVADAVCFALSRRESVNLSRITLVPKRRKIKRKAVLRRQES